MIRGLTRILGILLRGNIDQELKSVIIKLLGKSGAAKSAMNIGNRLKAFFSGKSVEGVVNTRTLANSLYTRLINAPNVLLEDIRTKLGPKEQQVLVDVMNESGGGNDRVFMSSSWIAWGSWESVDGFNGNMTLKFPSNHKNPSGIYTFYNVPRSVFELMSVSAHAGTKFWNTWYGIYSLATGRILSWKGLGNYRA